VEVRFLRANKRTKKEGLVPYFRSCSAKSPNKTNDQHKRNKPKCCCTRSRRASETRRTLDETVCASCRKTYCSRVMHGNPPFYSIARKHLQQFSCLELIFGNCNSMVAATKRRHSSTNVILILSHHCTIILQSHSLLLAANLWVSWAACPVYISYITVKFFNVTTQCLIIHEENSEWWVGNNFKVGYLSFIEGTTSAINLANWKLRKTCLRR